MENVRKEAEKFLKERGWDTLRPSDLAKSISIEAGELLELFQWTNPELEKVKSDTKKVDEVKKELADVLLYCLYMSILLEIDSEKDYAWKVGLRFQKIPSLCRQKWWHKGAWHRGRLSLNKKIIP